jgi:hypothetical protein
MQKAILIDREEHAERGGQNVAENAGDRLSATTQAKDRDIPFLASPPGAIPPMAFPDFTVP